MKRISIGLRLTLWYFAIFVLAELIFGAGMWLILRSNLDHIVDEDLRDQAGDLQRSLEAHSDASTAELQNELREDYQIEPSEDYLQIVDLNGNALYRSRVFEENPLALFSIDSSGQPRYENRKVGRRHLRFISEKMQIGGQTYAVQIGHPLHEEMETLESFRTYLLLFAPLLLLSASLVGYWVSRRALAPVDALTRTARTISGQNLSRRLEQLHTGDELQRLSDTLNEMLGRIESSFRRVTDFTADASHELRTPVALIHTEAELALRRSRSEEQYREALEHILGEAERTKKLLEELLALARADSGREALNIKAIDLLAMLNESGAKWGQVAALRNLEFATDLERRELWAMADGSAVSRVVDILLDNAFKYTSSPGRVILAAGEMDGRVWIAVEDTGVGIAPEEHAKIFERFYRVDKARSRVVGGSGLGLAIAQWIIALHQGTITVKSEVGKGSTFRIEIPAGNYSPGTNTTLPKREGQTQRGSSFEH
jgi:heavy metal sensor kinase